MAPRKGDFVGKFSNYKSSGFHREANDKFELELWTYDNNSQGRRRTSISSKRDKHRRQRGRGLTKRMCNLTSCGKHKSVVAVEIEGRLAEKMLSSGG